MSSKCEIIYSNKEYVKKKRQIPHAV